MMTRKALAMLRVLGRTLFKQLEAFGHRRANVSSLRLGVCRQWRQAEQDQTKPELSPHCRISGTGSAPARITRHASNATKRRAASRERAGCATRSFDAQSAR